MTMWLPPTKRDHLLAQRALRTAALASSAPRFTPDGRPYSFPAPATDDESVDNPLDQCPICRRRVQADMLVDVSALPAELRRNAPYACDGCRERWHATGAITREALMRALGAPEAVVAAARAHDQHLEALRAPVDNANPAGAVGDAVVG
jgi:hypothetical protein